MRAAAATSAHVCTPPRRVIPVPLGQRPYRPQTRVSIDFRAYATTHPPYATGNDASFWAMVARREIASLQATCTLQRQVYAVRDVPLPLMRALDLSDRLIRESIKNRIDHHIRVGGTDGAQLLVELNAVPVVSP